MTFGQNTLFIHQYFGKFMSCAKIRISKTLKSHPKTKPTQQQQLNNQTKPNPKYKEKSRPAFKSIKDGVWNFR